MSEASSDTAIKMNVLSTTYPALKGQTAQNKNHYPSSIELVQVEFPSSTNATTSPKPPQQFSKRYRSAYLAE